MNLSETTACDTEGKKIDTGLRDFWGAGERRDRDALIYLRSITRSALRFRLSASIAGRALRFGLSMYGDHSPDMSGFLRDRAIKPLGLNAWLKEGKHSDGVERNLIWE